MSNEFIEQGLTILANIEKSHRDAEATPVFSAEAELSTWLNNPEPMPENGRELTSVVEQAIQYLGKGYSNVQHPGFLGYISPKPDLNSILGDLLAAGHNQTSGAWRAGPFATVIERQVLSWLCEITGYKQQSGPVPNGIITNGGALANATALKLARERKLGSRVRQNGLYQCGQLRFYGSAETHFSIHRSLDFLGMGKDNFVTIPCDEQGRINVSTLKQQIEADIARGYLPCAVIAVAGTTATGQIDPLDALYHLCQHYQLWLHVDGAAGSVFASVEETAPLFKGVEKADSLCIDPCKWLFQSYGIGCLLVQDGQQLVESFTINSHYWIDEDEPDYFQMGLTGTRQWRTLGLWFSINTLGRTGIVKQLSHIRSCARHLQHCLAQHAFIDVYPHCELAVAVFRFKQTSDDDTHTRHLQKWLISHGSFFVSELLIDGKLWLRAAISNTHTKHSHMKQLADQVSHYYHHDVNAESVEF